MSLSFTICKRNTPSYSEMLAFNYVEHKFEKEIRFFYNVMNINNFHL